MLAFCKRMSLVAGAVAGLTFTAGAAQAQVVNGDFETGDLTGWNSGGNLGFTAVTENYPFAGTYGFQMGPVGSTGFIAQTLPLNAGDQVTFSFMLASDGGSPTHFDAIIDGQTVLSLSSLNLKGFHGCQCAPEICLGLRRIQFAIGRLCVETRLSNSCTLGLQVGIVPSHLQSLLDGA